MYELALIETHINYDWTYLSNLFINCKPFEETVKKFESDRRIFKSKSLHLFCNDTWTLQKGRLPDLRFQDVNFRTKIQDRVNTFIAGNDFLGLLIGPTGCGKSHEMLRLAKTKFTIFIDAQLYPASNEPSDLSLSSLKLSFDSITTTWVHRNEDLAKLRTIAYAFILSRMLFLKYLREKYHTLTPTQFLIHQLFNSNAIDDCFQKLKHLPIEQLKAIKNSNVTDQCNVFVDESHVLLEHLGNTLISTMEGNHIQQNNDVNQNAKRGTLSVLLFAIKYGQFSKKVIFAGTSSKLRNIDNFGTFETKPVAPVVLNHFNAWDSCMALDYVMSFIDIPRSLLENILIDNYRPRILENFVYDLFTLGMNDNDSPTTKEKRTEKNLNMTDVNDILEESYNAVIYRFTRLSVESMAETIRRSSQIEILLKLLFSSMMTNKNEPMYLQLTKMQQEFFTDTVGSIYLINNFGKYSFYEGYLIDAFLNIFKHDLQQFNLSSSLDLLKTIICREGKKSTAKGVAFEAVVLADIIKLKGKSLAAVLKAFDVITNYNLKNLKLPTTEKKLNDKTIISDRPFNVLIRPSNQFRPDILSFLSEEVCLSFGIKIYTSRISAEVHNDNLDSTNPNLFFSKSGQPTNTENQKSWKKSLKKSPLKFTARFLIELPELVQTVSTEPFNEKSNGIETVIIVITKHNMHQIFSEEVTKLVDFITSP
jgi:hypothetical protein